METIHCSPLYRLYIDESGDHRYYPPQQKQPGPDPPHQRYLGLSGVILEQVASQCLFVRLEQLKRRHFPSWDYDGNPLILHQRDIIHRKSIFGNLNDPAKSRPFDDDLLQLLTDTPFHLITVVIDKNSHRDRYDSIAFPPYGYCLEVLLERYCFFLNNHRGRGDVLAEGRGGREDKDLKEAYEKVYREGTIWQSSKLFRNTLTSHEIKVKAKTANIAGLQVADLVVKDSTYQILEEHGRLQSKPDSYRRQLLGILEKKYLIKGKGKEVEGVGMKFLG